jgi:hypothetical protein
MSSDRRGVPSITPTSGGRGWGSLPEGRAPCPTRFSYTCACLRGDGVAAFTSFPQQRAKRGYQADATGTVTTTSAPVA